MTHHTAEPPRPAGVRGWLLKDLPYAAMLGLAVGGIVLTSFRGVSTHYYWMALAPIYGLISIISGWPKLDTGPERMKLVVTQALHWLAFLGAMWLMFLPEVRGVFLAASVPAVAWIQESAILLLVGALLLGAVGFAFWWVWRRESRRV